MSFYPTWTTEIYFENAKSVGHIIGVNGCYIKKWLKDYGWKVIIDVTKKYLVINGPDELSVLKTKNEVQEKLLVSWKYIEKEYIKQSKQKDSIISKYETQIREKEIEIKDLTKKIKEQETIILRYKYPNGKMRHIPGWGMVLDKF